VQEFPQAVFAAPQLEPQRVVLVEEGGGGGGGGGDPLQAAKALKHCWPEGQSPSLEQVFPQPEFAAAQPAPQRTVLPEEEGGGGTGAEGGGGGGGGDPLQAAKAL